MTADCSRKRLVALLTVHNRRETTLACLAGLFAQDLPSEYVLAVVMVDDGSTDGTGAAVAAAFPQVQIIQGGGDLYWNQGMRKAWAVAAAEDYDVYVWLNDDTHLLPGALASLVNVSEAEARVNSQGVIVVGSCRAPGSGSADEKSDRPRLEGVLTYGGRDERGLVFPGEGVVGVLSMNGNLVAVSREAFLKLGNLSPVYQHGFGDIDYGIRAQKLSIPVLLAPGFLAECQLNPPVKYRDPRVSLLGRVRACCGPKGISWRELKHFHKLRGHPFWPLSIVKQYLIVLFPRFIKPVTEANRGTRNAAK